ncbi:NAD(P)-dependent oxidoreductase [Alphaproteobacteria bacterium]|nr:NAD(P)-dependent oxidoreductase [Alphaproteobacteria bacterium]
MNRVLVIGGSGFLGSHTADQLSENGYDVTIFDREASPWLRPEQKFIRGDVIDYDLLNKAMKSIDVVYYFASIADIAQAKLTPKTTINCNVMGVTEAMSAAVVNNVTKFIYASTMYVYSSYGSFYRASKQCAEIVVECFAEEYGIDYVFLRYGSLYGPRAQQWNGVSTFLKNIIDEGKINYEGDGKEIREYIHVEDAARLNIKILEESFTNQAITLTGQQTLKVVDMLAMLFEIVGKPYDVTFLSEGGGTGHYGKTPYRYTPKKAMKLTLNKYVDLGQGLLDLVEETYEKNEKI